MGNLFLLFYWVIYLVAVFSAGKIIVKFFKIPIDNLAEKKVLEFSLGNIFYSLLFIYLGIFHLLYKNLLLVFYLLPTIFIIPKIKRRYFKPRFKIKNILTLSLIFIMLFPIFFHLFSFPTSWDPLAYHLVLPKIYLQNHNLTFYSWFTQSAFPMGIEALFGFGELFSDSRLASFIVFSFILMTVVYFLYGLGYLFSKKILWLGLFLFLFRQMLYSEVAFTPFIDYPLAFYGFISSIMFIKYVKSKNEKLIPLFLFFGLFCILIKFTGIILFMAFVFSLIFYSLFNHLKIFPQIFARKKYYLSLLFIIFPIVYFFLRNFMETGNPVFPYLNNFFKGLDYDPVKYAAMIADPRGGNLNLDVIQNFLLKIPGTYISARLTILESIFSLVLLIFPVIGLFNKKPFIRYSSFLGLSAALFFIYFVGFPSYRYSLPTVPILAIITSFIFFNCLENFKLIKLPLILILFFSVILQVFSTAKVAVALTADNFKKTFASVISYEEALRNLSLQDNWQVVSFINKKLDPKTDKVLLMFDNRMYYYHVPVIYAEPSISGIFTSQKSQSAQETLKRLSDMEITYLVLNNNWGIPTNFKKDLFSEILTKNLTQVFSSSGLTVYKIEY